MKKLQCPSCLINRGAHKEHEVQQDKRCQRATVIETHCLKERRES